MIRFIITDQMKKDDTREIIYERVHMVTPRAVSAAVIPDYARGRGIRLEPYHGVYNILNGINDTVRNTIRRSVK